MIITLLAVGLGIVVAILVVYTIRHYLFTINRLIGRHRQPYLDIGIADWPETVVFVPAHNEEKVIGGMLDALLAAEYPADRLRIVPINDRSTDRTAALVDDYARRFPTRITPFHRSEGPPGKAAALADASTRFGGDIHLVSNSWWHPSSTPRSGP
jgi:cellulose synthase/poly-beta-1,6-N-acetylglucosamine synthase-like glycosyltransferase